MMQTLSVGPCFVLFQPWLESERGWGARPDGFSLHLTWDHMQRYIADYWAQMPDAPPAEYSRPCGDAHRVGVTEELYRDLAATPLGSMRFYESTRYEWTIDRATVWRP